MRTRIKSLIAIGATTAAAVGSLALGAAPAQASSSAAWRAASICGSGYWPDDNGVFNFDGGTIYVSYNGSTDCAVMLKTVYVGTPTDTWVYISGPDGGYGGNGGDGRDSGNFTTYAGPVYAYAPGACIEVAGGTVLPDDERWFYPVLCG
ncbi:MAG TPA: hypothetical protein VFU74_20080 [Actinocrinis sp.]|nr:hypothetical protein [Actinocrinis sp.]